jgi:hypothetical protein
MVLSAVGPGDQEGMNIHLAQVEDLHAQAMNDLQVLAQSGAQVPPALKDRLDSFAAEIMAARAAVAMMSDDPQKVAAWHAQVSDLQSRLATFIGVTSDERLSVTEWLQLRGLYWGAGAAVAVAAIGYLVWRKRRRRAG